MDNSIIVGGENGEAVALDLKYANRHGLIAGATGTGKTISVQVLAEAFANNGVPVFLSDVKGDLSGIAKAGKPHAKITARLDKIPLPNFDFSDNAVRLWDISGKKGLPVRLSISDLGPRLLARMLNLNETQEAIISIVFDYADDQGFLLVDLDDLKTSLNFIQENSKTLSEDYGRISSSSVSAIRRRLMLIEQEGQSTFFGEPSLEFQDLIQVQDGRGIINVLAAEQLMMTPKTYAIFLLWLMSELFENLPEVGDLDKPTMVLFFDEAHLLFKDCPKVFLDRIEQVVRLIRSKGVGIYFISQSPNDIPDSVLAQLGNRIQHALRAYTPKDVKALKIAAQSFRANPEFDTALVIKELAVGEALVSTLEDGGVPSIVKRTLMSPPQSQIGPISAAFRKTLIHDDVYLARYKEAINPESAHEILEKRRKKIRETQAHAEHEAKQTPRPSARKPPTKRRSNRQGIGEAFAKSLARSLGGSLGRKLLRGLLGSLLK